LIILRYIEEEKDESDLKNGPVQVPEEVKNGPVEVKNGPVQRNLHNVLVTKSIMVHEDLLKSCRVYFSMNLVATSLDTPYCL